MTRSPAPSIFYRLALFRLRLPLTLFLLRLRLALLRLLLFLLVLERELARLFVLLRLPAARRVPVERDAAAFLPPLREALRLVFLPRPEPLFFPPPVSLFTVAHALFAASRRDTPRFS